MRGRAPGSGERPGARTLVVAVTALCLGLVIGLVLGLGLWGGGDDGEIEALEAEVEMLESELAASSDALVAAQDELDDAVERAGASGERVRGAERALRRARHQARAATETADRLRRRAGRALEGGERGVLSERTSSADRLLERLERRCVEGRDEIARMAQHAADAVSRDAGVETTAEDQLAAAEVATRGEHPPECSSVFATLIVSQLGI